MGRQSASKTSRLAHYTFIDAGTCDKRRRLFIHRNKIFSIPAENIVADLKTMDRIKKIWDNHACIPNLAITNKSKTQCILKDNPNEHFHYIIKCEQIIASSSKWKQGEKNPYFDENLRPELCQVSSE